MKKLIPFILILLSSIQANSQLRQFLDSLKNDLQTVTDDSLRFRVLDELAWTYRRVNADSALMYAKMEIEAAKKLDNEQFLAFCYSNIGIIKKENELEDYGIEDLHRSLAINRKLNNQRGIASNSNNIGNAYEVIGKYDSAIKYLTQSIQIKLDIGQEASAASTMSNLGLVYNQMNNPQKAIEYYDEAISIVGEEDRRARGIFNNLGISYMKMGAYRKAREYFTKSIQGLELLQNKRNVASTYGNIGETYFNEGIYDSALIYAKRSFALKKEFGENLSLTYPAISLAKIYIELNQFNKAKENAELAYRIANNSSSLERKAESTYRLGVVEANLKNFERAATLFFDYTHIQDSINDENVIRLAEETEAKFQNELKEKENQILREEALIQEQKIRSQNIIIIAIAVILILLVAIAILLRKQLRERKKLLQKIEGQSAKLKELDQAKTRFFANISHDLRSPLTLILGSLDKITERDYEILDKESKELLDLGVKNGKRLLYLADEIMDLTRLEEGQVTLELQYVKMVPYLRLLTKMFSSAADIKAIELKFSSHAEDETSLQIDPHQFEKIIYNLLSNAIKFTPPNGTVDVLLDTDQTHLQISITDSGPGIPEESLDLIFDRYYQSANKNTSQAGVGIGLALVKELVELHSGTIKASNGNDGTIFAVRFPFKKNDWVSKAIVPERSLDVVTRNSLWIDLQEEKERLQVPGIKTVNEDAKAILIVEDHRELRTYLQSILSSDFRVYLAANGASALDLLQTEKMDLIITDLMMPYMDGFELVDHLKKDKELKKVPVMVVSARTDKEEKLDLISKGAEDVISKPFDKEELIAKIQNIMSRDWDSNKVLSKLYGDTAEEFEKNVMHKLENLIIKRVDDPHLSVLDLADEMAASERKVYRMIKKISGLTPYELIKEVRWQYLENYLKDNKVRTATEAAQIIGMNNVSSFASQYKNRFDRSFKDVLDS
ncbi:response regulator [Ekhidna sp.]